MDVISYETFNLILDRLKPYYYIPFYIAWYTGARIGEITALTWNDIDFEKGTVTINKQMTKILYKKELCKNQYEIRVKAPFITISHS